MFAPVEVLNIVYCRAALLTNKFKGSKKIEVAAAQWMVSSERGKLPSLITEILLHSPQILWLCLDTTIKVFPEFFFFLTVKVSAGTIFLTVYSTLA